jgi:heme/copper-type cytochrome/quinol oxidase subunit 1
MDGHGRAKAITALFLLGGYGLVMSFAVGGAMSIPRRFPTYPEELSHGAAYSQVSLFFVFLLLLAMVLFCLETVRRYRKGFSSP